MKRPGQLIVAGCLIGFHGVLAWIGRSPGILTGQDDALYVILARSLLQGTYRDLQRVDAPLHSLYPPGYPAELSGWGSVFGFGFDGLVIFNVLCSMLALALIWDAARRFFSGGIALALLAPLSVNPLLLEYSGTIASEPAFMLAMLVPLWLGSRAGRSGVGQQVAKGAVAILAALTRAAGAAVLAALALEGLLERRWKRAVLLAVAGGVLFGGWLFWSAHAALETSGYSYLTTEALVGDDPAVSREGLPETLLGQVLERSADAAMTYLTEGVPWAIAAPTVRGTVVDNVVGVLLMLVCGFAGLIVLLRRWRLAGLYLVMYCGLLVAYRWFTPRFVVPLVPLVLLAILVGADWWARKIAWRPLRFAGPAIAVALLLSGASRAFPTIAENARCDRESELPDPGCVTAVQAGYFEALDYVRDRFPSDAVLLTMKSGALYYYTGLRSISTLGVNEIPDRLFIRRIREAGAGYVLLTSVDSREFRLSRRLLANCDALVLEAAFAAETYLFRLQPAATPEQRRVSCESLARYRKHNWGRDYGLSVIDR